MSEKERERGEIFSHGNHHSHSISCPFLDFNLNYKKKYFIFIYKKNNISHWFTKKIIFFISIPKGSFIWASTTIYNVTLWMILSRRMCLIKILLRKKILWKKKNLAKKKEYNIFMNCLGHIASLKPNLKNLMGQNQSEKKKSIVLPLKTNSIINLGP